VAGVTLSRRSPKAKADDPGHIDDIDPGTALGLVHDHFCRRLARLKLRAGVSGSFRIRRDNNVDFIDPLQYAREIAGQRANSPASCGRST